MHIDYSYASNKKKEKRVWQYPPGRIPDFYAFSSLSFRLQDTPYSHARTSSQVLFMMRVTQSIWECLHFIYLHTIWSIIDPFSPLTTGTLVFSLNAGDLFAAGIFSLPGPIIWADLIPVIIAMQRTLPS